MTEMPPQALKVLTKILRDSKSLTSVAEVHESMLKWLDPSGSSPTGVELVNRIIDEAVSELVAEMVIDYPSHDELGNPQGKPEWHLKLLDDKARRTLAGFSPEQSALLRILYKSNSSKRIGAIREEDALKVLHQQGFDVSEIPSIEDRVSYYFSAEGGKRELWIYLIPEHEKSPAYKRELERLMKKHERQEDHEIATSRRVK